MNIQDMVKNLEMRIAYNKGEAKHYAEKARDDDRPEIWKELEQWYTGRQSGLELALEMIKENTVGLEFE